MKFHQDAKPLFSQALDTRFVPRSPTSIHPWGSCTWNADKLMNSWPHSCSHSLMATSTCSGLTPLSEPLEAAGSSLHTLPLSSFAASCLLEPPRPSSHWIPTPWGRQPRHGPCAAGATSHGPQQMFNTTQLLLGNGNKLIFATPTEQSWNYERLFRVSSIVVEAHTWNLGVCRYPRFIHKGICLKKKKKKKGGFSFLF